jgi:hypothetical protein
VDLNQPLLIPATLVWLAALPLAASGPLGQTTATQPTLKVLYKFVKTAFPNDLVEVTPGEFLGIAEVWSRQTGHHRGRRPKGITPGRCCLSPLAMR